MDATPAGLGRPALSAEARLAQFLFHATKTGVSSADRRTQLLAMQVPADHPHAVRAFRAGVTQPHDVYIDASRLPCDHGRRA